MTEIDAKLAELGGLEPVGADSFVAMTEAEIQEIEQRIGARLPEAYRKHLATFGASAFHHSVEVVSAGPLPSKLSHDGRALFSHFYGAMSPPDGEALSLAWRVATYVERMPDTIIPMGSAGGGDQICIGVRGREQGKVYYWDHNNEWDEEDYVDEGLPVPEDMKLQNVHYLAESFEDFILRLEVRERSD